MNGNIINTNSIGVIRNRLMVNYQSLPGKQREELKRKFVHFCAFAYIVAYYLLPRTLFLWILGTLLCVVILFELLRLNFPQVKEWWLKTFFIPGVYRREELNKPSALPFTLGGAFFTAFFFSQTPVVLTALSYQVFGDGFAALVGQRFGKIKIVGKTLAGSITCFMVCFAVGVIFFNYKIALIGAAVATTVELLFPYDNLWLPVISALVLQFLTKRI